MMFLHLLNHKLAHFFSINNYRKRKKWLFVAKFLKSEKIKAIETAKNRKNRPFFSKIA